MSEPFAGAWRRNASTLVAFTLMGALACASVPPPVEQMAQAREKVQSAQTNQAGTYAPLELRKAQDELAAAERAFEKEENLEARHHAEISKAQAELAMARAQRARAEAAVNQLTRTVSALEDEIRNSTGREVRQ